MLLQNMSQVFDGHPDNEMCKEARDHQGVDIRN
jgi:hypothetical protein